MIIYLRLAVVCAIDWMNLLADVSLGVESPSVGNSNTVSTRARLHYTVRLTSHCVIGAGCLVAPIEDEILEDFTVRNPVSFPANRLIPRKR